MKKKTKRVGILLSTAGLAGVVLLACSSSEPQLETVGSTRQAITPNYTEVPGPGGALDVGTTFPSKPTGPGGSQPTDPYFCYFSRIAGPLNQAGDYVQIDENPTDGNWHGYVARAGAMNFRMGCTRFGDFTNAGNATSEGYSVKEFVLKSNGVGAPNTSDIPTNTAYRTPSFAPLTAVVGNFLLPYNNCNLDGAASAFPLTGGLRTGDITTLSAQGVTCPGVIGRHNLYESSMKAYGHSQTKWSGAHGNGTIRFGAFGPSSVAGTDLMPKADGACWIASIGYQFSWSTEQANIFERTVNGVVTWAISSTTDGSAYAQCIKYDQW